MGLSTNILHLDRFGPDIFIDFPWDRGGYDENRCFFRASPCCANTKKLGVTETGASPWDHWGYRCPIDNLLVGGWEPWKIIPTDELSMIFRGWNYHQPDIFFFLTSPTAGSCSHLLRTVSKKNHQPHHQVSVPGSIPCCITWVSPCDLPFFHGEISNVLALQVRARNRLEASAIPDAEGRKSDAMEFLQKFPSAMPVICFGSTWQHGGWNSKMMGLTWFNHKMMV